MQSLPFSHFLRGQHQLSSTKNSLDRTPQGLTTRQLIAKDLAGVRSDVMPIISEKPCHASITTEVPKSHVICRFMMVPAVLRFLLSLLATNTICIIPSANALCPHPAPTDPGASCLQIPIDPVWESNGNVSLSRIGFQNVFVSDIWLQACPVIVRSTLSPRPGQQLVPQFS